MAQVVVNTFVGDTAPVLQFTLTRTDGSVVDLTGATVRFRIQDPVTGQRTNDSANTCTITNPSQGQCEYLWNLAGTDLPDEGTYDANIQITYPDTRIETADVTINAEQHV